MLFQHPSNYQIDSIYTGYIESLDILILLSDPNSTVTENSANKVIQAISESLLVPKMPFNLETHEGKGT